ncbi:uncharacterized protein BDV17DRAFT_256903 [Aspergillus undulatus]|uniref:uncharacterized protein n=1 Tax=Aspergillus undulatus TaxID=1810928 RepID=UPI003CCCB31D
MLKNGKSPRCLLANINQMELGRFLLPRRRPIEHTTHKRGTLFEEDPYVFHAAFFNKNAAEAIALDPKQRIAMEVTYEAF